MRRILLLCLSLFFVWQVFSQRLAPDKYWIPLADKNNSSFTIQNPAEFLSPEAIKRRTQHGIPVTIEDIPVVEAYLDSLRNLGLNILGTSKWFNAAIVRADSINQILTATKFNFVIPFDPETAFRIVTTENSISDSGQINISKEVLNYPGSDYGNALKQLNILGGLGLHDMGYKGRGMKIAVLDAGFFRVDTLEAFSRMWEENRVLGYLDLVNRESDFFRQSAHGMSVLSTMAAYLPGVMIGTAPEASYWLIRSEDASSEYKIEEANWVMAAEFADSAGAHIINSSLGYNQFNDSAMNYSYQDMNGLNGLSSRAADIAFEKGIIVIVSAGNEGNKKWQKITAPADGKNVLAVGAVDTALNIAIFSSEGPSFDNRIKPDVLAVGAPAVVINSAGVDGPGFGTSYSAPQIAGLIACLWQALPHKKNHEIISAVIKSSDSWMSPGNVRGYGLPDFMQAFYRLSTDDNSIERIKIAPNPFVISFNISFDIEVEEIIILDLTGKKIISFAVNLKPYQNHNITPHGLTPGVYLISGRNKYQKRIARIIKQ